jgi:hypothetical protein
MEANGRSGVLGRSRVGHEGVSDMRVMLLGFAAPLALAVAMPAAPAAAQNVTQFSDSGNGSRDSRGNFGDFVGGGGGRFQGCDGVRDGRGRRGRGGSCDISVGTWVNAGEWALYNNRTWESDSYNDWWHDRPDRAYPRWMSNNQNCQRQYWSGGGWRC